MSCRRIVPGAWRALVASLALSGCDAPRAPAQRIEAGDATLYAGYVQPYVEVGCATLDCHGDLGHALRLYSELGLRRTAALRPTAISEGHDPLALTSGELEDNQRSFAAIALASETPAGHLALLKPLALSAGGIAHEGPVLWPSTSATGYRCLRAYLVGDELDDADPAQTCARALDELLAKTPASE